jgi:hypothetical protein
MSEWEDKVSRHTKQLVQLTLRAANQGPKPLPEDEVARLGAVIATERMLLVEATRGLLRDDDPEAASCPGVAEFDSGFLYGIAFGQALEEARVAIDRLQRGKVLKLVKGESSQ